LQENRSRVIWNHLRSQFLSLCCCCCCCHSTHWSLVFYIFVKSSYFVSFIK
jgi:hypothetical protein